MTFGRQKRPKEAAAHPVEKPGEWFCITLRIRVYCAVDGLDRATIYRHSGLVKSGQSFESFQQNNEFG
jgi:hypothetical protein